MASRDYGPGEVTGMGEAIYEEQSRTRIGTVPRLISYNRTTRRTAVYGPVRTVV